MIHAQHASTHSTAKAARDATILLIGRHADSLLQSSSGFGRRSERSARRSAPIVRHAWPLLRTSIRPGQRLVSKRRRGNARGGLEMDEYIVVHSDGETWERLEYCRICRVTPKQMEQLENGDYPKHVNCKFVVGTEVALPNHGWESSRPRGGQGAQ